MARDLADRLGSREVSWMEGVWAEADTTPARIESALRDLLKRRHARSESFAPARALNLIVIADREWRGEIENRLEGVGRYHASRTILCAVEPDRTTLDALAAITTTGDPRPGELALCLEEVVVEMGTRHLPHVDTICNPLLVPDLATVVWSPHGHEEAVDALLRLAEVVLLDSDSGPDPAAAIRRARSLSERAYVVDLAWLRSTPWRERIAAIFDPPGRREELGRIASVTVRHRPGSGVAGLLLLGWLATRLGWEPGGMAGRGGSSLVGRARGRRGEIGLGLEADADEGPPGLSGVSIELASGTRLSLDRGPGGLAARRTGAAGGEEGWTLLGASRGEAGILGEGIRQVLLRDPTYGPALDAAAAMAA